MASTIRVALGVDGAKEFQNAMKESNAAIKTLGSELKLTTAQFGNAAKSEEGLKAQNDVLERTILTLQEKLTEQEKALSAVARQFGEGSVETQKFQQAVNQTKTDIANAQNAIDNNTDAIESLGSAETDATEKTSIFGDVLKANLASEAITAGIRAIGGAVKEIASAVGDVIKASVSGYAESEQLVGGVETLFGESADKVQAYAQDAYQTAGLSANEYMSQVTSFSAALLQGLGGDTAKAADVADMAMRDMSDNANKMGTDMSSIQTAYQGFAKGQYTLLDNLKLGYGGTKTEMERLLADAEEFSGVHYDIDNLSDVYEAVHVIQTEMGITGTTAKEASTTIEGSVGAVKSAWTNLLTAFGDPSADISKLSSNVVSAAQNVINNVVPIINNIVAAIPAALSAIVGAIVDNMPTLIETATEMFNNVVNALMESLPTLLPVIVEAITLMSGTIIENLPMIIDAAVEVIATLAQGIGEALPDLIPALVQTVIAIVDGLVNNMPMMIDAALQLILGLAQGLIAAIPELIKKAPEIIKNIVQALLDGIPDILDVGVQLVKGLWDGIVSMADWLWSKVTGFFDNIVQGVKDFLGIHSPSRVFAGIGENMALGIGEGFEDTMVGVGKTINSAVPIPAIGAVGVSGGIAGNDIVINLTSTLDGNVLARNQYKYNSFENARHGASLIGGLA